MPAFPAVGDPGTDTVSPPNDWASKVLAAVGASMNMTTGTMLDGVSFGTNPASAGTIRLPNDKWIAGRNAANSADVNIVKLNAADYIQHAAPLVRDSFGLEATPNWDDQGAFLRYRRRFTNLTGSGNALVSLHGYMSGVSSTVDRSNGLYITMEDDEAAGVTTARTQTITAMSRSGTTVTVTSNSHGFANGDKIAIYGVTHTFNAQVNGAWTVANQATNTFDITVPGISSGTYTSGGKATNRAQFYGVACYINPTEPRGLLTGTAINADDIAAYVAYNGGTQRGTDCVYLGNNATTFNKSVTNAVTSAGLIRLTVTAHGCATGESVVVQSVGGVPNADGKWTVTAVDANTLDLQASTFAGAYTSGGTVYRPEFWSLLTVGMNAVFGQRFSGAYSDYGIEMSGIFAGPGIVFDGRFNQSAIQVSGVITSGAVLNVGSGATISGSGVILNGTYSSYGILLNGSYTAGAIRIPNNTTIYGRNAANSADVAMMAINTLDEVAINTTMRISGSITIGNTFNLSFSTSTGSMIGTGATQKIGFWGKTPIAQPSSTGETVGFTAGGGTTVTDASTFTGNVGSTAYRLSDLVKHLKKRWTDPRLMPPKLRDLSLTQTERTAITALLQVKATLQQQAALLEQELAQVGTDIEKRLRLPAGSLGTTYDINAEDWKLQQIDRNGDTA